MKARSFEKNGFPKPLGFILIVATLSIVCLFLCLCTGSVDAQMRSYEFVEEEPIDISYRPKEPVKDPFIPLAEETESEIRNSSNYINQNFSVRTVSNPGME